MVNVIELAKKLEAVFKQHRSVEVKWSEVRVEVKLYNYLIFSLTDEGEIYLDNGDNHFLITKRHINKCLEVVGKKEKIYQRSGVWYFSDHQKFQRHFRMTLY